MTYLEFRDRITVLRSETGMHSSPGPVQKHPMYLELLDLGDRILPYVFYMMQFEESHCLLLLALDITGHCPVWKEDYGRVDLLTASWVAWAKWHGFVPWE